MKLRTCVLFLGILSCLQIVSLVSAELADCRKGCKEVSAEFWSAGDHNCYYYEGDVHCTTKDYTKVESPDENAYSCIVKSPQETLYYRNCTCEEHCKDVSSGSSYKRQMDFTGTVEDDCGGQYSTDKKDCL